MKKKQQLGTIIQEIEKEVAIYLEKGTVVTDLFKNDTYEISEIKKDGILLEHKPYFKNQAKADLPIEYNELLRSFTEKRFIIQGFSTTTNEGHQNDVAKLKRAIHDTTKRIELCEKEEQAKLLEAETKKLQEEQNVLLQKKKSQMEVRKIRNEEEFKKREAENKRKEDEERIKKEEEHQKQIEAEEQRRELEAARIQQQREQRERKITLAYARAESQMQMLRISIREKNKNNNGNKR